MKRNTRTQRKGAAAVEFALVASLLFVLIFAIISMGLCVWCYNTLSEACQEGARYAAVRGFGSANDFVCGPAADDAHVQAIVKNYCFIMDPSASVLTIHSSWDPDNHPGSHVTVSATYKFSWFFGISRFSSITLKSSHTMAIAQYI
ncbi:hypothetical protein AYO44_00630 [Planctomycetaceae bacterium SCGC AG-212-F19]|nr:hypothetical protein AYO44_00630 [Planctomycetaceae bacterium SCGC AG-212-F19]